MKGRLTPDHTASVEVEVLEAGGTREFVVDTGFSDFLYLPEDLIVAWGLPFVISTPVVLADQSTTIADVYEATVIWFGTSVRVHVIAGPSGCDLLLGMKLLEGCRIELDRVNGEVRIEPL